MGKTNTNPGGSNIIKDRESQLPRGGGKLSRLRQNQNFMDTALLFCLRLAPRIFDVSERIEWSGIKYYRVVFVCKDVTTRIYEIVVQVRSLT